MANILDKAIAAISPEKGYRRAVARTALSVLNNGTGYGNYGASHTSRSMRSWRVGGGSAKEDIEDNLETLRKRSRDAYMGIPLATGAIKTLRTNVVGSGLVPTPQVDADYLHLTEEKADQLQAQIAREFSLWADSTACDAAGMDNFWRLQTLAFTSFLMNGDVFAAVQFRERPHWPYALQLRLIEADQVCSPDRTDHLAPGKVNGKSVFQIVQGVAMSNQVATSVEIPSEVLYKKFSSNYSASRGALNEFWRTCGTLRDSFADDFCQPTYEKWFAEAVARGRINAPGFFDDPAVAKAYMGCTWNGPARTNLDAKKEIEAAILRMDKGISTAEQETAQMTGGSWRANMRQRKSEMEKIKEVGCDGQTQFQDDPEDDK